MNHILGQAGEALAAYWLDCLNYHILESNLHCQRGEIDLVCQDSQELVFVEVRLRSAHSLQSPVESVTYAKRCRIYLAAASYLSKTSGWQRPFRFDLIEIELTHSHVRVGLLSNFLSARGAW